LNSKPLPSRFITLPPVLEVNLLYNLLQSLTAEWVNFASYLTTRMKQLKKIIQHDVKGWVRCIGSERLIIRNEVVQTMRIQLILRLSIFGRELVNLRGDEIVERTKRGVVVHIATRGRVVEIFRLNLMCACDGEHKFINYPWSGKVAIEKDGRESIGYITREKKGEWFVVRYNR